MYITYIQPMSVTVTTDRSDEVSSGFEPRLIPANLNELGSRTRRTGVQGGTVSFIMFGWKAGVGVNEELARCFSRLNFRFDVLKSTMWFRVGVSLGG